VRRGDFGYCGEACGEGIGAGRVQLDMLCRYTPSKERFTYKLYNNTPVFEKRNEGEMDEGGEGKK
jgi:hypothetical protein